MRVCECKAVHLDVRAVREDEERSVGGGAVDRDIAILRLPQVVRIGGGDRHGAIDDDRLQIGVKSNDGGIGEREEVVREGDRAFFNRLAVGGVTNRFTQRNEPVGWIDDIFESRDDSREVFDRQIGGVRADVDAGIRQARVARVIDSNRRLLAGEAGIVVVFDRSAVDRDGTSGKTQVPLSPIGALVEVVEVRSVVEIRRRNRLERTINHGVLNVGDVLQIEVVTAVVADDRVVNLDVAADGSHAALVVADDRVADEFHRTARDEDGVGSRLRGFVAVREDQRADDGGRALRQDRR